MTAYDRYALRAFEVHALDYLLKPVDEGRFAVAFEIRGAASLPVSAFLVWRRLKC